MIPNKLSAEAVENAIAACVSGKASPEQIKALFHGIYHMGRCDGLTAILSLEAQRHTKKEERRAA